MKAILSKIVLLRKIIIASITSILITSFAWALDPQITVNVEKPERPVVMGTTNLPDGTELMITIKRGESGYRAQDKVKVSGGKFRSTQFSQKGSNLNPGNYTVEVLMPIPAGQSNSVLSVTGDKGEKLKGKLVQKGMFGGKIVKKVSKFSVGSGTNAKLDKKARTQEKKDKAKWIRDSCNQMIENSQRLVKEGKLQGRELNPEEKQQRIEKCIEEMNTGKVR